MSKKKLPSSFYNPVTLAGTAIAIVSFGLILFLLVLELLSDEQKPYMGIIAFVVLPAFLILGLILIAYGIFREHRREKLGIADQKKFPVIDLNDPKQRSAVTIFIGGTILLLIFTAFGSFKAYEYTDSDEFCGTVCHSVMEPEYTAYQFSPHAKVGCVKCHIGSGTEWYVRSKFSGAYQVYSVLFNKYSKPIPTPIENLRPAQETCEQCHWPSHFYSEKKHENTYFVSDENNSKWKLTMLMKIGGGYEEGGVTQGIHWHMNIANEITYYATDSTRMVIPWVKSKSKDGTETIYKLKDYPLEKEITSDLTRRMDCIDCHNRPSHIFHPPMRSVNHLMDLERIDSELPFIKSISVRVLDRPYSSKEIALDSIRLAIEEFYNSNYPSLAVNKKENIEKSISEIQNVFKRNYFPSMNVSWRYFPDQIGHMYAPGCFRCHDGKHFSNDGKVISHDCNVCHTLLAQEFENAETEFSLKGVEYKHPVDIGDSWKEIECSTCHLAKK
jgi:nitrate/TMAO reductase-like tetraheme cytochrome c subunit